MVLYCIVCVSSMGPNENERLGMRERETEKERQRKRASDSTERKMENSAGGLGELMCWDVGCIFIQCLLCETHCHSTFLFERPFALMRKFSKHVHNLRQRTHKHIMSQLMK